MDPDYRQLIHLLEISRCGTFSRAAGKLHMSQPALSNSIAQLELRLNVKVLIGDDPELNSPKPARF